MRFGESSPYYRQPRRSLEILAAGSGPWRETALSVLERSGRNIADTDDFLQLLHEGQRLHQIRVAGLEKDEAFYKAVEREQPPFWRDFGAPPADCELQIGLAEKLYNVRTGTDDFAFISLGSQSRLIGPWLVERCVADKAPFVIQFGDPAFHALMLNHASEDGILALAEDFLAMTAPANRRIAVASGLPEKEIVPDEGKNRVYRNALVPYGERLSSGDLFFTLTVIPTPRDAEIDGFGYEEYTRLFFEMCDQPWDRIDKAQQALIREFDTAKEVRITNSDGTDIVMDIEGFTFCNSLIAKNVPGSEIFSAPRRDSVNGRIVAKGRFTHGNELIENLTLEFRDGELVRYDADAGLEAFEKAIELDEGARYVGELGIGTNPHLKTHVANGLLVEKIGGSFHVALGKAYTMKEYAGVPVNVDNGNRSALHWDITTMLYGKEGRIYLDGRPIMDHGRFLDPRYDVLNRGWEAVPEDERPAYWKGRRKAV